VAEGQVTSKGKKGLTHSTIVGFFWSFSSTGIQATLHFLVFAILSRLVTPAEFGLVNIANILTVFAGLFYQLGIGPSIIQRRELRPEHIQSGFTLTIILGAVLTGLSWVFAPVFASFFDVQGLVAVLRGLSFLFILNSFGLVARALNYRNLNFKIKAKINAATYVVGYGLIGVGLAAFGFGVWALVWASLSQSLMTSLLYLKASPHSFAFQLNKRALTDLLSFGTGVTLGQIFNRLANTSDNLIVGATLGARAVGLYGRAYQLMVLPSQYFGQVLDSVLYTAMAKVQDQPKTLGAVYRRGVVAIALVVMPMSAFLFILAPEFVSVLVGKQWGDVIVPFKIFAVTMLFRTSYKMGDSLCRSAGIVFQRALRQFLFSVMIVAGAFFGHYYGIVGVTVGVSVAITLNFFSMAQLSFSITDTTWIQFFRIHLPAAVFTVIVFCETWALAGFLRGFGWADISVLFISAGLVGATLLSMIWFAPKLFLGKDGLWMLKTFGGYLPAPFQKQVNRLLYR